MGFQLNDWDQTLIEKYLPAYRNLKARIREPSKPYERHLMTVFVDVIKPEVGVTEVSSLDLLSSFDVYR